MIRKLWSFSGVRFIAVGVINTIVDFSLLNILVFAFGLNKIVANTISVSVAMAISYVLNNYVVFRYEGKNHAKNIVLFVLITAFGLFVLQNATIYILLHWFTWPVHLATTIIHGIGLDQFSTEFISLNFAKVIGTGVSMVWNYFMYRQFVFSDKKRGTF